MRTDTIDIGINDKPFKYSVKVDIPTAENIDDCLKLAHSSEAYVVQCFMRGHRVKLQDSEARNALRAYLVKHNVRKESELTDAQRTELHNIVANAVQSFDPTAQRERSNGRTRTVTLPASMFKGLNAKQRSDLIAQFAGQNVVVELDSTR